MSKSEKAFRNISEVSEWLATPTHVLRFWESKFSQIKPIKRAGGRRYYRPKDMLIIGGIKQLLHIEGHTIKGAKQVFREKGLNYVVGLSKPLMSQDLAGTGSDKETITKVVKPFEKIRNAVSSQIDIDRLDYLQRDSYFTGVTEGRINSYRIIDMLDLNKDKLVMDHKAAYSIEKFLLARQFMYWQVYLHKTVISAEFTLLNILNRAKELIKIGYKLKSSSTLDKFLKKDFDILDFEKNDKILNLFCTLDDYDIFNAIKEWSLKSEKILSYLCRMLINRNLLKVDFL